MTFRHAYKNVRAVILWRMDAAVGCLLVTHFPVKAELARRPDLVGRAVVVATGHSGRRLVVDASPAARGVRAGQMLTEALSRCADAVVLAVDDQYLSSFNDDLMHSLFQVADRVEPDGYGRFYLDLTGMASMYGGASGLELAILSAIDASLQPRLGLASGKFPSYCAAASAEVGEGLQPLETLPSGWHLGQCHGFRWTPISWRVCVVLVSLRWVTWQQCRHTLWRIFWVWLDTEPGSWLKELMTTRWFRRLCQRRFTNAWSFHFR